MRHAASALTSGPFLARHIKPGDPYELSSGHALLRMPTLPRGARAQGLGAAVLISDPSGVSIGTEAGFSPQEDTLWGPDLAVLPPESDDHAEDTWVQGVPPLAVEYADRGQDERKLKLKIQDLLARGTRWVWVVRVAGVRRVEVHAPGQKVRKLAGHDLLEAPGVLQEPIPASALYDRAEAERVIWRNMLKSEGYSSLEDVYGQGEVRGRAAGRAEGLRLSIRVAVETFGIPMDPARESTIASLDAEGLATLLRALLRDFRWP